MRGPYLAEGAAQAVPWTVVRADDKRLARINLIKDILSRLHYAPKDRKLIHVDQDIVSPGDEKLLRKRAFLAV